ncbi:hypothetical protein H0274_11020 [Altererythrobacter sp. CC-YST694]|uniref:hypothetical protein n=1 Tax=Altererythrobacter sp. CC-YST694 TaxID=2755038 RepID=UPI001D035528|nr:hypothetical protein [Altererythrobacter sp. CC-YST694]MCB5425793.1 hypothetical protein [Altererythrobacter sp. CC-YST694]
MNGIGNSPRKAEPLRVAVMAAALVVAACAGAGLGFLLDLMNGDEAPAGSADSGAGNGPIGLNAP